MKRTLQLLCMHIVGITIRISVCAIKQEGHCAHNPEPTARFHAIKWTR